EGGGIAAGGVVVAEAPSWGVVGCATSGVLVVDGSVVVGSAVVAVVAGSSSPGVAAGGEGSGLSTATSSGSSSSAARPTPTSAATATAAAPRSAAAVRRRGRAPAGGAAKPVRVNAIGTSPTASVGGPSA